MDQKRVRYEFISESMIDAYARPLKDLPLQIITEFPDVKEYLSQEHERIKNYYREKYILKKNHVGDCQSWLLVLHYQVLDSLRKLYKINSDEFIVLNAVRLYTEITRGLHFTVGELRKAFPHMKHDYLQSVIDSLITKGFMHTNLLFWGDDPKKKLQISKKGFEMIDAFHDRFREVLLKFEEQVGDIPGHMILKK